MIDFDDPRLILCDDAQPSPARICQTCHGSKLAFDEYGYAMPCHGPCKGMGWTDLPLPEQPNGGA
jgi:hypothetical protein